jgi:glycosyltransferase involved in cell wall biosynthesis
MQPGLVSIIMPAYNSERYICQAIESVLAQSYPQWELIIVNDGSTDCTAEIVAQYTDPRLTVIHQANGGVSAARNIALEHTQGEFVAFLDADDTYLPHHLKVTVGYLQTHSDSDGVYTDGYHCDPNGTRLQTLSSRRRGPFEGRIFEELMRASDVFGPPLCVVLRRHPIVEHNLRFDDRIVIGEDWDFFTHYSDIANFGYIDQPTCLYRIHQTNVSVRTDLDKQGLDLAICREKAIKMDSFNICALETRVAVFYDLLVNLLIGFPERQSAITQWKEFKDFPAEEQARLYRLMASKTVTQGGHHPYINHWFRRARELNPADQRGALLATFYNLSPQFCQLLLRAKNLTQAKAPNTAPFSDIK